MPQRRLVGTPTWFRIEEEAWRRTTSVSGSSFLAEFRERKRPPRSFRHPRVFNWLMSSQPEFKLPATADVNEMWWRVPNKRNSRCPDCGNPVGKGDPLIYRHIDSRAICPSCAERAGVDYKDSKAWLKCAQSTDPNQLRLKPRRKKKKQKLPTGESEPGYQPRRKSGNKGHRLQQTRVVSPDVKRRMNEVRKPQPVKVIHADGRVEVHSAHSFVKPRQAPKAEKVWRTNEQALEIACPRKGCHAEVGIPCVARNGKTLPTPHSVRRRVHPSLAA